MFVRVYDSAPPAPGRTRARGGGERSFEVQTGEDGRVHLRIWGNLPRGWAGDLTSGIADAGLSVERGFARRGAGSAWIAAFVLSRTESSADPLLLDYLALAASGRHRRSQPPDLDVSRHRILPGPDGCAQLEVSAPDRPGFLAGLLERLSFLRLEPAELEIRTEGGRVADRLLIRARDGGPPSAAVLRILSEAMDGTILHNRAVGS
ncbi:MAG: hypothetical protein QNK05_05430 [Myxococcota bacterium]|nr:hypothetical protein [Myxococcota bacterium]